nr:MAG TPA: hypothetical protein [Caudoviricetes sp.]
MPQTPRVRFNFKNLNVQSSVPLLGVINVVARTTNATNSKSKVQL